MDEFIKPSTFRKYIYIYIVTDFDNKRLHPLQCISVLGWKSNSFALIVHSLKN